ncbi:MAG: VOC family protein [Verrucomicrobia bacterium]|nr:VOC family protein [Verrucomicrobiota bacterium]
MGFHAGWGQCTDQLAALVEGPAVITPTRLAEAAPTVPAGRTVSAYLNFDGRCAEALAFYEQAVGVEIVERMLFKDAPPSEGSATGGCGSSNPDLIMHAAFRVGQTLVMASDCHGAGHPAFAGISLALGVADAADAARCFAALSPGGSVCMPLGATFWSPAFGVVTDHFGVTWMINAISVRA